MSPRRHRRSRRQRTAAPVRSPEVALSLIADLLDEPRTAEVLCLLLDHTLRTCAVLVFDGMQTADDVVDIAETVTQLAHDPTVHAAILVSCRPAEPFARSDIGRWHQIDTLFDDSAIDLLDWFVVDQHTAVSVCAASGSPVRWPGPDG